MLSADNMLDASSAISLELIWDLALIILASTAFAYIMKKLKQPSLLAYIFAGIVIGPAAVSIFSHLCNIVPLNSCESALRTLFSVKRETEIRVLSDLGIVFLLFLIGIESDFRKLRSIGKLAVIGTVVQVALTAFFTALLAFGFGLLGLKDAIYVGVMLAFSSTMVVVKFLSDRYATNTLHARLMIGFLLMQDLLLIMVIPMVTDMQALSTVSGMGMLLLSFVALLASMHLFSKYVAPRIFRFTSKSTELLFLSALSTCFGFIFLSSVVFNMPEAIGAFIGGVSLSMLPYNLQIYDELRGLRDFFVMLFFVTLGMQLSFVFSTSALLIMVLMLFVVFFVKPAIFYLISMLSGHGSHTSFLVAIGLAQVSEFSLIIARLVQDNFTNPELYSATITVIAISMIATPYLLNSSEKLYRKAKHFSKKMPLRLGKGLFDHKIRPLEETERMSGHVVIIGGGVMGKLIATALKDKAKVMVVDHDPEVVEELMKLGINATYGEADNRIIWRRLNLKEAKAMVITVPRATDALRLVRHARKANPNIVIFARAHTFHDAELLYEKGVNFVCLPLVLGSNLFIKEITEFLESNKTTHFYRLQDEFLSYIKEKTHSKTRLRRPLLRGLAKKRRNVE